MLFDLRGKGRRRTVQVIYIGLAVLIGLGLVGFGIGGGFGSGGLFNAATNNEGASKTSHSSEIKQYEKLTKEQPKNFAAWEKLILAQLEESGGETYVQNGKLTSKGDQLYLAVGNSWRAYLAQNPPTPSARLAQNIERIFSEEGLNEPAEEVQALQIAVAAHPEDAALFGALATYAYKAKNPRVGDLATAKAVALTPAAERTRVKDELQRIKEHPSGTEGTATSESGQSFNVKTSANGKITATPSHSTDSTGSTSSPGATK